MWAIITFFVCVNSFFVISNANECTDTCDKTYQAYATTSVTFCGTDGATHSTYFEAIDSDYCYATCGLMAQYSGPCGCPNNCLANVQQGKCDVSSQQCVCEAGWGGDDCSLPIQGNSCSHHGQLILHTSSNSKFPFDYCACDVGFTGTDCSTPVFQDAILPWGELYPEVPQYNTDLDQYGDNHPVFNLSQLSTIRVTVSEEDFIQCLLPENLYNESYVSANVYFDNAHVQETILNVGFRIKGAYSRMDQKKGWVIKFNNFVKGQNLSGLKKIGLKSGSVNDDTFLKTKLYNDLYRTMNAPTQRSSFALLYINNIFAGLYYMHEDIGSDFAASRNMVDTTHYDPDVVTAYPDSGAGNLYKFFWNVHLGYYGSDLSYYQTRSHINELQVPMYYYEQSEGNGDWSDFLDLLYYFNTSDYTATDNKKKLTLKDNFYATIDNIMEVDNLLRGSVVESFMLASDNMASGANYYLYHHNYDTNNNQQKLHNKKAPAYNRWVLFDADFDECFRFDKTTLVPHHPDDADILGFFVTSAEKNNYDDINPLMNGLLANSSTSAYQRQYLQHYVNMLSHVFQVDATATDCSSNSNAKSTMKASAKVQELPQDRYARMMQFLLPWVTRDMLWQFSFNTTSASFVSDAEFSISMLPKRAADTWAQAQALLA